MPGAYLFGTVEPEPVGDWSFANDVPLCQMEIRTWRPHSINLNCMSADGILYVSCSSCAEKYWSNQALASQRGRVRMGDSVYPVTLRRVTDTDELELAWSARLSKLGMERATPRPAHWWSFHLTSR
jgi:hypothetical protein